MKFTTIAALAVALLSSAAQTADITGAGSTFAAPSTTSGPLRSRRPTAPGELPGIGSSGGIKQIIAKTVDFAGSDAR